MELGPDKGIVSSSVVTFRSARATRSIQTWEDIVSSDAEVITPNPATSGGAKWNIMAAYGSQINQGKSERRRSRSWAILEQTSVLDDSARDSLQTFSSGKGDVLIGYENEAIQAQDEGIELEYVIPEQTILIENPGAVTDRGSGPGGSEGPPGLHPHG